MAVTKTSLSAGEIIRLALTQDAEVAKRANKIYPVVADKADLPYVVYRRLSMEVTKQKNPIPGADRTDIEVLCFTEGYAEGVELAEAVRETLDYATTELDDLRMRSCYLSDSEETWQDDAFVQRLVFTINI